MIRTIQKELTCNLRSLNLTQGVNITAVSYLDIYCFFDGDIKLPELNKPYVFYIADGSIRLHTPSGILDYVSGQYWVSTIDISFAVCDEHGLLRVYRRFGEALVLSIKLVPDKAYTAAACRGRLSAICKRKDCGRYRCRRYSAVVCLKFIFLIS